MHPTARYQRCIGITRKGDRCRNTGSCAIHKAQNEERRRRDDDAYMKNVRKANEKAKRDAMPRTLLSMDQIRALIEQGIREDQEDQRNWSNSCGCQGGGE